MQGVARALIQTANQNHKMTATGNQLVDLFFEHRGKTIDKWEHYLSIYAREFAPFHNVKTTGSPA